MILTPAQKNALKADIDASELAGQPNNDTGNAVIAAAYNLNAAPAFTVWKSNVLETEIMQNGFDWVRVDNLSIGKARIWEWMFKPGFINPTKANVRAGIDETWKGTQADLDVRAAVYVHCKRLASRAERLFAVGTGSDAVPAIMATEGTLTIVNVEEARNS